MKHNAEKAINNIQKAISELGGDFALSNAKGYLLAALKEINHVNKKRIKRDLNQKIEFANEEKKRLSKEETLRRVNMLEKMFQEEESKLQNGSN